MATQATTVDFLVEQMSGAGVVMARKMFGEYALYCDERLVALVCEDQLFVKPTAAGRAFIGAVTEAPPYKGAKPYLFVAGEQWDDRDWLGQLIKVSAAELPLPVKKAPGVRAKSRPAASHKA
jgi:TfoX/Sxy family transcriptional regulator of competence genes